MAKIDRESIKKLKKLCRIRCTEEEEGTLLADLENILSYVEQLEAINTDNVAPCNHVLAEINNVMREDLVEEAMPRELFLNNAPDKVGGFIKVPSIIKSI